MNDNNNQQKQSKIYGIDRQLVAIAMMVCGSSLITLGFVFANERKFHPTITGIIRGFTALVVCYIIARWKGVDLTFPSQNNYKWQLIRNGIMFLQGIVYAWSQFYLPLPIVVTLYAATPIFTAIWDYLVYGVSINQKQKGWFALAFIGVLLTSNGSYLHDMVFGRNSSDFGGYISRDPMMQLVAGISLAVTQFIHGLGVVTTKKMNNTTTLHVTYFVGVMLLVGNALLMPTFEKSSDYHWPNISQLWEGILYSGLPLTFGMLGFNGAVTLSHRYGLVAPFQFAAIIVGYLISVLRYGEPLNIICVTGTIAIVVGVIFVLKYKDQ